MTAAAAHRSEHDNERGRKPREVAELLDLSVPRVDQLAKGK